MITLPKDSEQSGSLRHDVHFICPKNRLWPELVSPGGPASLPDEILARRSIDSLDCWVTRTFYELRLAGFRVTISPAPKPDAINIAGIREFGRRSLNMNCFTVIPRADGHQPALADFVLLQNNLSGVTEKWPCVQHWPQPGLISRNPARGNRVTRIAFKGNPGNLDPRFRAGRFIEQLEQMGIFFEQNFQDKTEKGEDWRNFRDVDVVIAARNLTYYDAMHKPVSKLVNAWWAEVPALLGPEPAFEAIRRSELDYFSIRTPDDAIGALKRLNEESGLYRDIVNNGQRRREAFTTRSILKDWVDVLSGPVAEAFEKWKRAGLARRFVIYSSKLLKEPYNKRMHLNRCLYGPRILDD